MSLKINRFYLFINLILGYLLAVGGCSTTEVVPLTPPVPPVYTQVPHPEGTDISDLAVIFKDHSAPKEQNFLKTCDEDFTKLKSMTLSIDEFEKGVKELVKRDPVSYHWCFYGKLLNLENDLKGDLYIDEKQKKVIEVFQFLVPVAKVFSLEYRDSRYLRWAVVRYSKMSERIFYRKLELTPVGTSELVQPANPFGLWRKSPEASSVLDKYNIIQSIPQVPQLPVSVPITATLPLAPSSPSPIPDALELPTVPASETPVPVTQ